METEMGHFCDDSAQPCVVPKLKLLQTARIGKKGNIFHLKAVTKNKHVGSVWVFLNYIL